MTDLNGIPTESLLDELQRRINSFIARARQLLGSGLDQAEPEQGIEQLANWEEAEPAEAPEREEVRDAVEVILAQPTPWTSQYTRAQAAGLGVPNRDPNRELPEHLKNKVRELPKLMDPAQKAAMWAGVDRDLEAGLPGALADAEASGNQEQIDYLRSLPDIRARSGMAPPSLAQIVAINKRNSQDAFIQPILPPTLKGAVQAPTITEIEWFDNPAVVNILLSEIVVNTAPLRPGIPPTPNHELEARIKGLAKLIKTTLPRMLSDGYTGHLPRPVAKLTGWEDSLQLLLEPVVIWRLLLYLEPHLPYVHYESNLRNVLSELIRTNVKAEEQVLVAGDAGRFRSDMSAWLVQRYQTEDRGKICQALKRQIRILNVDMQEKAIPAMPKLHDLGAKMPFEHPRELFKDTPLGLGAQVGKGKAKLNLLPEVGNPEGVDSYHEEGGNEQ